MNEKIISKWEDFDGERTDGFALDNWSNHLDVYRLHPCTKFLRIYHDDNEDIPEAITILNALGFNFRLEEA